MTAIEKRLHHLERQVSTIDRQARFYRRAFLGMCLLAVAAVTIAAVPQVGDLEADILTARRINIHNKAGQTVASLYGGDAGGELWIDDANGKDMVGIYAGNDSGEIWVFNDREKSVATITADTLGGTLRLKDAQGQSIATISGDSRGGRIHLLNHEAYSVAALYAGDHGGELWIDSNDEHSLAGIVSEPEGGFVTVKNSAGDEVVQIYADKAGQGYIGVWNSEGKGQTLTPSQ